MTSSLEEYNKMKRRNLLFGLGNSLVALWHARVSPLLAQPEDQAIVIEREEKAHVFLDQLNVECECFLYHDWEVHWTGWKRSYDTAVLVGQWLAWPHPKYRPFAFDKGRYFYASTPGNQGEYQKGECFDITPQRFIPAIGDQLADLRHAKAEALQRLLPLIRHERSLRA
jgi:hypothetical protein